MIISKPKNTALFALGIFIILCFSLGGYAVNAIINDVAQWYHYVFSSFLLVAIVLLVRQVLNYKIVRIGTVISVSYPLLFRTKAFKLKDLITWQETIIKTKNDLFKQLELRFNGYALKISIQENSNYLTICNFLKKKAGKKELT